MESESAYGLWPLVIIHSLIILVFAFSFTRPKTKTDWRSFGGFTAFIIALFTEMYGFPLTIYLLSGWLTKRFPEADLLSHEGGHLWNTVFGWKLDAHFDPLHILSNVFIVLGFVVLASAWRVLYRAQREGALATSGPYARVRHPQYDGFLLIMFGFLLQWPTIPTLVMFPILAGMYVRLARKEEEEVLRRFGDEYRSYAARTPGFLPRFHRREGSLVGNPGGGRESR